MKKRLCVWILMLCLLLAACNSTPAGSGGTLPSGDPVDQGETGPVAQNKYIRWSRMFPFIETDNAFYGLLGGRAYYYDCQNGFSDFLCADPSCAHDSADCSSYMQEMSEFFTYYNGKLYWFAPTNPDEYRSLCLYRCDPDGYNREKVMELDYEKIVVGYTPQKWMLHQGKLFFIGDVPVVVDKQACYRVTFGYLPLDGDGEAVLLYDELFPKSSTIEEMLFCGDTACFAVFDGVAHTLAVMRYDLRDNSQETLLTVDNGEWADRFAIWITEAGTVYVADMDTVYRVHGGELEAHVTFDKSGYTCLGDGVAFTTTVEDGVRMIELRTYAGALIYQGELFPEPVEGFGDTLGQYNSEIQFNCIPLGVDTEKLIVCMQDGAMRHVFSLDINNGMKATYLWSGTVLLD